MTGPAILFAVADNSDRTVANGFGIAAPGVEKIVGGLRLTGTLGTYPAIVVASAPYLPLLLLGLLLCVVAAARIPFRSRT